MENRDKIALQDTLPSLLIVADHLASRSDNLY